MPSASEGYRRTTLAAYLSGYNIVLLRWSPSVSFAAPPLTFVTSAAQCRFWQRIARCVLLRGVSFWSLGPKGLSVVGPSACNDFPVELRSLLMTCPSKFYIFLKFFFVRDWSVSASE